MNDLFVNRQQCDEIWTSNGEPAIITHEKVCLGWFIPDGIQVHHALELNMERVVIWTPVAALGILLKMRLEKRVQQGSLSTTVDSVCKASTCHWDFSNGAD
jgi:hypothetical protein